MTGLLSSDVFEVLSLLKPYEVNLPKVRIGRPHDGGYVLADLPGRGHVISFGICGDVEFEHQMAERGHSRIYMFDHTIEGLPYYHEKFDFHKIGICANGEPEPDLLTLEEHTAKIRPATADLTLKMDVEGYEWGVFANLQPQTLIHFEQIVLEVHNLGELYQSGFAQQVTVALKNLNANFTLFHVHANNFCPLKIVAGFVIPDVLELSYVRTSLVDPRASRTFFPTELDRGNDPASADYLERAKVISVNVKQRKVCI